MMFRALSKVLLVFTLVSALPSLESAAAAKPHRVHGRRHHKKQHRRDEHNARKNDGHDRDRDHAVIPPNEL